MPLTKKQFNLNVKLGLIVWIMATIIFSVFGARRAQEIGVAAHRRWHETTGQVVGLENRYGVVHPLREDMTVSYPSTDRQISVAKFSINLPTDWQIGDHMKMWYDDHGKHFIPADPTADENPWPISGGTFAGYLLAGFGLGLIGAICTWIFVAAVLSGRNGSAARPPSTLGWI